MSSYKQDFSSELDPTPKFQLGDVVRVNKTVKHPTGEIILAQGAIGRIVRKDGFMDDYSWYQVFGPTGGRYICYNVEWFNIDRAKQVGSMPGEVILELAGSLAEVIYE